MITIKQYNSKAGFTMIEMLVAVFIFTVATVSFLGVIMNGYYSSRESVNTAIASNLAQEGIELIEAKRYSNSVNVNPGPIQPPWKGFDPTVPSECNEGCSVDPYVTTTSPDYIKQSYADMYITIGPDGKYGYNISGGVVSKFKRKITISLSAQNLSTPPSYLITSEVTWKSGLSSRKVKFSKYVTIWDNTPTT